MKKFNLVLLCLVGISGYVFARHNHETSDFCSSPNGACHRSGGPTVATTFCPTSGCPCTAKICKECEDCPM